jgi:DNA topoisomerase-1
MANKNLVIVESPSKAKTIEKFLGSKYKVMASVGHLKDLPKSRMGVDIENGFEPDYINVRGKAETIKEIKNAAKEAPNVFLATDPDREGEAISWHLCSLLGIDPAKAKRIEFNEITKPAITEAVKHPRAVDMALVDAQQGRRVIDRVVGFKISPLLWNKVAKNTSAGRVQSAALKMIVDREREIQAFVPEEYWVVSAKLAKPGAKVKDQFVARLETKNGKKLPVPDEVTCNTVKQALEGGAYSVASVKTKRELKKPYAPYTTSSMMQDASSRLGFSPERTRRAAQQLYEGGYVTYIRTDSVRISDEADAACKAYIAGKYTNEYIGSNRFENRNKGTQDAHEAIRPSHMDREPEKVKDKLQSDTFRLYQLIWNRFVASRMKAAVYDSVSADIACRGTDGNAYGLKAAGRHLIFDGFLKVYDIGDEKDKPLPALEAGDALDLKELNGEQRFTEGPSRFTEASLIRELEEKGIGRPSTYASIVSTLDERKYVKKEKKSLVPSKLGTTVTEIMEDYFKEIVDAGFTAEMEEKLDDVADGKAEWRSVVGSYYDGYVKDQLVKAGSELEKHKVEPELTGETCPQCGKPLVKRQSRYGEFVGCSGYPQCRYIKPNIVNVGVKCPKCGGELIKRRSKKNKTFYGCSNYPNCDQVYWYEPVDKVCPQCGSLLVKRGRKYVCSSESCKYSEAAPKSGEE